MLIGSAQKIKARSKQLYKWVGNDTYYSRVRIEISIGSAASAEAAEPAGSASKKEAQKRESTEQRASWLVCIFGDQARYKYS